MNNLLKNLDFNYFSAKNFFCFGPEGVEIDLKKYGNIILVRGENLDIIDDNEEEKIASNGIGKSSIPEIIIFCLFGKTIRYPKKVKLNDVINNQSGGKCRVEVRWNKYRVVRTREPDSLQMWESADADWSKLGDKEWEKEHEISKGGGCQSLINDKLGLNYETLVNLLVFADQPHCYFLEADGPQKRDIIENLMTLHEYKEFWENAKDEKKDVKNTVDQTAKLYEQLLTQYRSCQTRITSILDEEIKWKKQKKAELETLANTLSAKEKELSASDHGQELNRYYAAQKEIEQLNNSIPEIENRLAKVKSLNIQAKEKWETAKTEKHQVTLDSQNIESNIRTLKTTIKENEKLLSIKDREGQTCGFCYGQISEANFGDVVISAMHLIEDSEKTILLNEQELTKKKQASKELQAKVDAYNGGITKTDEAIKESLKSLDDTRKKINTLGKIEKPEIGTYEKILEEKIAELKKQIIAKEVESNGPSPYVAIMESAKKEADIKDKECKDKKRELEQVEGVNPYIDFWIHGYSPKGIPKSAIMEILPALNDRIAHWLQFLIDGKIALTFDGELNETIERNPSDGDPFIYYVLSGGERRRLNLAVSQAFAYIMMLSSGVSPSLVFLDEVTTNIDPIGVIGVYNMILELSKEKQVFVTTHDQELLNLLSGNQVLFLRKKGGFTTIA